MGPRPAERELARQLSEAIAEIPGFSARVEENEVRGDHEPDFVVQLAGPTKACLMVECKTASALYPRDVREWLWQIRERIGAGAAGDRSRGIPVLASDILSPGVREMLKAENVGYYDRGGSLFLPLPGAFVLVDRPARKRAPPERSLFTDRRALVVHALLRNPHEPISVNPLAEELRLSAATVSETLALLDRMNWTRAEGLGPAKRRRLTDPSAVLGAWGRHVADKQPLTPERYFVPGRDAAKLAERFGAACVESKIDHAFTGEIAGQALAPLLSGIHIARCRVAADAFLDKPLDALGARPVTEGANLECLRSTPGELFFTEQSGDLVLASAVQIYLDLLRLPGRAKELAAHLRREKIGF